MQDEAELVGERALAGGPVGGELDLVLLDQVFRLSARAVQGLVEMAGLAGEGGNDVARVEAARGRLQPGDDPAFPAPGAGGVGEGGEAPHPVRARLGAAHLDEGVGASLPRSQPERGSLNGRLDVITHHPTMERFLRQTKPGEEDDMR